MTMAGRRIDVDERSEPRHAIFYRTRLTDSGGVERPVTLVDLSPNGFMARCNACNAPGDKVTVALPRLGPVTGVVRWSLGGRIGCRLNRTIDVADYHALIHTLPRG